MEADAISSRVFRRVQVSALETALQEVKDEVLALRSQRNRVDWQLEEDRALRSMVEKRLAAALAAHAADVERWEDERGDIITSAFPDKGGNHRRTAVEFSMLTSEIERQEEEVPEAVDLAISEAKKALQSEGGATLAKLQGELNSSKQELTAQLHMEELQLDATRLLYELRSATRLLYVGVG